jgi:hypothetical protein
MQLLKENCLIDEITAYGGWNTSANSIGTTVAHSNIMSCYKNQNSLNKKRIEISNRFLFLKYLEDWGYQHKIRADLTAQLDDYGLNYFNLKDKEAMIANQVKERLDKFKQENLNSFDYTFSVEMPWNRMFEVKIEIDK